MGTNLPTSDASGPAATMAKPVWYKSLYWRVGLGFVLFLALVVSVQAGALVWLTGRVQYGPPSASSTRVIADELSAALGSDPALDIAQFFRQQDERLLYFFVLDSEDPKLTLFSIRKSFDAPLAAVTLGVFFFEKAVLNQRPPTIWTYSQTCLSTATGLSFPRIHKIRSDGESCLMLESRR